MRTNYILLLFCLSLLLAAYAEGQSPNGTISGLVVDPSGAVIVGAEVLLQNDATGVQYPAKTNGSGIYLIPNVPPGIYRLQVSKIGFKTLIKPDITLNVQDALAINFTLPLGAASETVTVTGGNPLIETQSGSVSTVIDRNFVQNLPLNGRSFNTLLQLTPGVVIAQTTSGNPGQFSISGQRTSANNFLVDGVSANFGVAATLDLGATGTGAAQAFSALGGTSSLVSVEALQEFRVETSSFAPEFGRSPGGQVLLTTRSGTNDFHGGLYEYFRNTVLDANDWFAKATGQPRAPERHNDFGGFFGGPIQKDATFFFVSYEGARLRQPGTMVVSVPSEFARTVAPSGVAPFLDAYPLPDDRSVAPGVYTRPFTGNYSNSSTLDAGSVRIDHNFGGRFSVFGRYNEAPSVGVVRTNSLSEVDTTEVDTRTLTLGSAMALSSRMSNSLRANYSLQSAGLVSALDSFGGAAPISLTQLAPGLSGTYAGFYTFDTSFYAIGRDAKNRSTQLNFADDLGLVHGAHQLKFGVDYRLLLLNERPFESFLEYEATSVSSLVSTLQSGLIGAAAKHSKYRIQSTSLYAQDVWNISRRLTLTYGLRWELDPAPSPLGGTTLAAWRNVNNPSEISLAEPGTPLWSTTYANFGPRVGIAYTLTPRGDAVLRGGWGIYYDLGLDSVAGLGSAFPNYQSGPYVQTSLPLTTATPYIPVLSTAPPYSGLIEGYAPSLKLPRSYQWNVAFEKSFGGRQTISVTYVGQEGRNLLRKEGLSEPNPDFLSAFLLTQNNARSNYDALEVQYRHPLGDRFQALVNYTWSHSLDNASDDVVSEVSGTVISAQNDYASSDFDVRQSISGAMVYSIPAARRTGFLAAITRGWSVSTVLVARSGFPFNASVLIATIGSAYPRPNLVPNQPIWVSNPQAGGGKSLNPMAFTIPPAGQQGNEGRNDISGFGLTQIDASLERKFAITERLNLQFRTDAFNLLNHPNFTNPYAYVGLGNTFLSSSSMLNRGLGGLNPLFQEGGPRSLQVSLKLNF